MTDIQTSLPGYFQAAARALDAQRSVLNDADPDHGNHGTQMVAIFQLAAEAAHREMDSRAVLADQMEKAALLLRSQLQDETAQAYALGLQAFARRFRAAGITLDEMVRYVRNVAADERPPEAQSPGSTGEGEALPGEVLKALVNGLADWNRMAQSAGDLPGEDESRDELRSPGVSYLFELGLAYLQAKTHSDDRVEVLAETAVMSSPLVKPDYRAQSGRVAIAAFLRAMLV